MTRSYDEPPTASPSDIVADSGATVVRCHFDLRMARRIAATGMSEVFVAREVESGRQLAIKTLADGATDDVRRRLQQEAQILAVMDHPNVVRYVASGTIEHGKPFIAMEYVQGVPITEYARMLRLTVAERLRLLRDVCDAVQYVHSRGVIHADLKPANLLVTNEGSVKLLDFGISHVLWHMGSLTTIENGPGFIVGTPGYMAPERYESAPMEAATDVYTLGVIAWELLTGESPSFAGPMDAMRRRSAEFHENAPSARVLQGPGRPSRERRRLSRLLRSRLDKIVARATHPNPRLRYPSVHAFAEDLSRAVPDRSAANRGIANALTPPAGMLEFASRVVPFGDRILDMFGSVAGAVFGERADLGVPDPLESQSVVHSERAPEAIGGTRQSERSWPANAPDMTSTKKPDGEIVASSSDAPATLAAAEARMSASAPSSRIRPRTQAGAAEPNSHEATRIIRDAGRRAVGEREPPTRVVRARAEALGEGVSRGGAESETGRYRILQGAQEPNEQRPTPAASASIADQVSPPDVDGDVTGPPSGHSSGDLVSAKPPDSLLFSVTAPAAIEIEAQVVVDVWAHLSSDLSEVLRRARIAQAGNPDDRATTMRTSPAIPARSGDEFDVQLRMEGATIDEEVRVLRWDGTIASVSFLVRLSPGVKTRVLTGEVHVRAAVETPGGVLRMRVAKLHVRLAVLRNAQVETASLQDVQPPHEQAFVSYSHKDQPRVADVLLGMQKRAPHLRIWLDALSLRAGDHWEEEIRRRIPESDVFYLFWSEAAKASTEVEKEWKLAFSHRGQQFIDPVPLDLTEPPLELKNKHFFDRLLLLRDRHAVPAAGSPPAPALPPNE